MANSNPRYNAISSIDSRLPKQFEKAKNDKGESWKISDYYGINTFNHEKMKEKLSKEDYTKLTQAIESGKKIDKQTANAVAKVIQEWASEKGVTHFCHWFQPQTGITAEKHDSFLTYDDNLHAIEKFSGAQLIQSEPDASSFPSGGMRTTFEARGYTAWDMSSPIFIMEGPNGNTLCVPSVFISYYGDALDEKTPLMRSMDYLNKNAVALLHTLGFKNVKKVVSTLGAEQEYFLIDRQFYNLRPDLIMAGRTLLGGQPPRGQQLEDHYFGSIPQRVLAFMQELEFEQYRLGVPAKTRHNEVAPSQFETAPIFEEANVATDHNQILMDMMKRIAQKHNFACLIHEKPFAGINGNGKHCNWSMAITDADEADPNLLEPGKTPHQNIRFLMMLAAVLKGVYKNAALMRAAIAVPGNDHRLGANEAPPAIISAFLGQQLTDICKRIESGSNFEQNTEEAVISLGVSKIPTISKDNTDRNRTSPFAFTGNKFEFRAVGGSMVISFPVTVLNTAVGEAMSDLNEELKKKISSGKKSEVAALEVIKEALTQSRNIRFEGNNYSEAWLVEAEKRGLPNLKCAPDAIEQLNMPLAKELFKKSGVLSEAELHSRYHVMIERYTKKLMIETDTLISMIDTYVVPAAIKEQQAIALSIKAVTDVDKSANVSEQSERLKSVMKSTADLIGKKKELTNLLGKVGTTESESDKAEMLATKAMPIMNEIRTIADGLENIITDEYWMLPKYREMLFIS